MDDRNTSKPAQSTDGNNPVGLTPRLADAAEAIVSFTSEKGYPPTYAEIGAALGIHKANVKPLVDRLVYLLIFTRKENEARTLVRTSRPYFVKEKKAA